MKSISLWAVDCVRFIKWISFELWNSNIGKFESQQRRPANGPSIMQLACSWVGNPRLAQIAETQNCYSIFAITGPQWGVAHFGRSTITNRKLPTFQAISSSLTNATHATQKSRQFAYPNSFDLRNAAGKCEFRLSDHGGSPLGAKFSGW